jgi:protein transport protein SEC31
LSWCKQDADLLLSCGKDNRVLCWNPQTAEIIGELPPANNWAFQVEWCPRNPDLFATAFFDGTVGVHSIQSTNESVTATETALPNGADIFDSPNFGQLGQANLSLKQPLKWLRRLASVSCGFGGRIVTVGNLPSARGRNQSSFVHLRTVTTEKSIVDRAKKLQDAIDKQSLNDFAEEKAKQVQNKPDDSESWKVLLSLFHTNSREELITLFGLSKGTIASQVEEAIKKVKVSATPATETETEDDVQGTPHEPVVSFIEPEKDEPPREGSLSAVFLPYFFISTTPTSTTTSTSTPTPTPTRLLPIVLLKVRVLLHLKRLRLNSA